MRFSSALGVAFFSVCWIYAHPAAGEDRTLRIGSVDELRAYYTSLGYEIEKYVSGNPPQVPRVYVNSIPAHWADHISVSSKKSVFYRTMLPLILRTNELIVADRERLLQVQATLAANQTTAAEDDEWLSALAFRYRITRDANQLPSPEQVKKLSLRVDTVPVGMALAQAADESGYGTSRFASEGNAFFGQWTWHGGLAPAHRRNEKGRYGVADFPSPLASAEAYAFNLNTGSAYREFRMLRAAERRKGIVLDSMALAVGLARYSERGEAYVKEIRGIIRYNKLTAFDAASLRPGPSVHLALADP